MEAMPKVLPFQKQHDIFVAVPPLELPRFLPFQSKRQEGEWSGARARPAVWAAGVVTAVPGNLPGILGDLPLPSRSRQEPTLSLALLRQLIDSVAGSGQDGDFFQLSWDPVYRKEAAGTACTPCTSTTWTRGAGGSGGASRHGKSSASSHAPYNRGPEEESHSFRAK